MSIEDQVDKILNGCVTECADIIYAFDSDDWETGREVGKFRNQIVALIEQERRKAKREALEGVLKARGATPDMDDFRVREYIAKELSEDGGEE